MNSETPLTLVAAERLRRIFGEPDADDSRVAVVATQADAEHLHRLSTAANRTFLILVSSNPDQKPAIADGGSLRAIIADIAEKGRRIHDPVPVDSARCEMRLWSPPMKPKSFGEGADRVDGHHA